MIPMKQYSDVSTDLNKLSGEIVDCLFQVHRELGAGYPEDVYEEAFAIELKAHGLFFECQKSFEVFYKGKPLSKIFRPDVIVENQVVVELKAVEKIHPVHQSQIYSYLKVTELPLGLLVNFNVPLIKDGIGRYLNKNSVSPDLRVNKKEGKE